MQSAFTIPLQPLTQQATPTLEVTIVSYSDDCTALITGPNEEIDDVCMKDGLSDLNIYSFQLAA